MPSHGPHSRDTELDAVAEELRVAVGHFVRRVRTVDELPGGQAAALGYLAREGSLAITDLADREQVRHQSMARTVRLLTEQRFVDVLPDEHDRRRVVVRITKAGRTRLDRERRNRSAKIAQAMATQLSADERDILRRVPELLARLTVAMTDD